MKRMVAFVLVGLGCGASSNEAAYPTWEDAERQREECGGTTAAIEVDSIEIEAEGTRSQRMRLEARILSGDDSLGDQLTTDQYVGGDQFMHQGERYIVALCPTEAAHQVVGWKPLVVGSVPEAREEEN